MLSVIGHERDELTHSRLLAWLLDPSGSHDLGAGLLQRLAERVGIGPLVDEDAGRARVRREVVHPDGRADLVIDLPEACIGIENKIDAVEQREQCTRMVRAFGTDDAVFLFLTLDGHKPHSAGAHLERWTAVSYSEVAGWIETLTNGAGPERCQVLGAT